MSTVAPQLKPPVIDGAFALAPDLTMTVLRFFGLGGVVDKVLKRGNGTPP